MESRTTGVTSNAPATRVSERIAASIPTSRASSVVIGPANWGATFKDDMDMLMVRLLDASALLSLPDIPQLAVHRLPRSEDLLAPVQVYSRRNTSYRSFRFPSVADAERFLMAWQARPSSLLPDTVARQDLPAPETIGTTSTTANAPSSAADILAAMARPTNMPRVGMGRGQARRFEGRGGFSG